MKTPRSHEETDARIAAINADEATTMEQAEANLRATMTVLDADARLHRREKLGAWWYVVRPLQLVGFAVLWLAVRIAYTLARFLIRTLFGRIVLLVAVLTAIFYAMGVR
ncbi:MAG: hypothetical protein M3O92_00345 [Actinomycetota bacterium]|nr:hypothetical protein [Actinomycetota bacterium]